MHDGCVLLGRTGSGKTMTALGYWLKAHPNQYLYVVTTPAKRDAMEWEADMAKMGLYLPPERVISWNKIKDFEYLERAFIVFDEQRVSGSGKWVKSFLKIAKRNDWVLLSATPGDVWIDWLPLFIANGFYRTRTQFTDRHVIWDPHTRYPRIKRYIDEDRLERCQEAICVYLASPNPVSRMVHDELVSYDSRKYAEVTRKRWNPFEVRPMMDAGELCRVQRRIVLENVCREEALERLLKGHPRALVFYSYNYELEAIKAVCERLGRSYGQRNGHRHDPVPVSKEPWAYIVQYQSADAWNCISTNIAILYSLPYSWRQQEQAMGRIDRMNTPFDELHYYRLMTDSTIDNAVLACLDRKETFNERAYENAQKGAA
uniref:Chromatin remodeling complex ATPase n=1 Tax=Siphoviridae sp. ctHEr2 TaxID=2826229 RepID=A0A8S5NG41_9CAUD|nr:MAG TPA: Chromatin remodeling complex ATPase [Siphoviridae sp. ctHEr2]